MSDGNDCISWCEQGIIVWAQPFFFLFELLGFYRHHIGEKLVQDKSEIPNKMATKQQPFEEWLCAKLLSLDPEIDTDVFVMYINGILETDDSSEEKKDSMSEILAEVFVSFMDMSHMVSHSSSCPDSNFYLDMKVLIAVGNFI